ncbi:tyrosine-type recombinase/integrase [Methylobacterium dankookense]|uniref:Tyrosine recombinase XerC n=1 Tax=Methylobacterium dankookense TaxID=560405 RepID=A0A564G254_9HYPH|nr:site-specific integrase [Methylobacterium dankookense]GJD57764.1 Tyrosine recombinase XerC [Methylobacterium dankookense]VUF14096.1 Tyrosine recombinase XerC [Methylobacterium dankookense]
MSRIRLRYVDHFTDRHGTVRYYFRRPGGKRTPLPGLPGSEAFMAAYAAAMGAPENKPAKQRGEQGTFDRLVALYYESAEFKTLKAPTQRAYRLAIERLLMLEKMGPRPVRGFNRTIIKGIMAKRVATPSAANDALKKLRILMKFALDLGWRDTDPTLRISKFKEGEHHTWTDEEIERFEAHWPIGSVQRTAFALLLFTGQRVSDVAAMSWKDVSLDGQRIRVTQEKTGTKLDLALHDDLLHVLADWPKWEHAILQTSWKRPFSVKGLGNKMADAIGAAGLPDECVTHGLRKAAARRLAEAGCTAHEIASITGHRSLAEVERYTRAAGQRILNDAATLKLASRRLPNQTQETP